MGRTTFAAPSKRWRVPCDTSGARSPGNHPLGKHRTLPGADPLSLLVDPRTMDKARLIVMLVLILWSSFNVPARCFEFAATGEVCVWSRSQDNFSGAMLG